MVERIDRRFVERDLSGQDKIHVAEYGTETIWLEPQNRPETNKPQKVKVPRRTRGRGRWIKPKI